VQSVTEKWNFPQHILLIAMFYVGHSAMKPHKLHRHADVADNSALWRTV
jgi:hypothetical protein